MNILVWIIFGALTGWIASMIMGKNAQMGALAKIVVGIVGAIIGGWFASLFGIEGVTGFNIFSMLVAIVGAAVLLFLVGFVRREDTKSPSKPSQEMQASVSPKIQQKPQRIQSPASPKIQQKSEKQSSAIASARKISSGNIFVSYRRTDSADVAGRIYDRLVGGFGKVTVFKDVDSIPLGLDFKEYLDEKVSECNVLLAIIGDRWLEASDSMGRRRLEDPFDFVRIEIESALGRGIPVIPLLVRGALMPAEEELPTNLKKLVYRNGIQIRSDPDFHRDMDRLISALKNYVQPTS